MKAVLELSPRRIHLLPFDLLQQSWHEKNSAYPSPQKTGG